jgi:hypothetical protein
MSRLIVDTFMINGELDMLECRLTTMSPAVDYFLAIEADVDHQGHPKPYHLTENIERFAEWGDRLIVVKATDLPTVAQDVMLPHDLRAWSREWAQRDWVWQGLQRVPGLTDDAIVLHGDVDEICHPLSILNALPRHREFVIFAQTMYSFAVDWLHPDAWGGTVAVTVATAREIGNREIVDGELQHPGAWQLIRNNRNGLIKVYLPDGGRGWASTVLPEAGWHFTWLGGAVATENKLGAFCHPEVADRIATGLASDSFMREGFHTDGRKMIPVDVDDTWPVWIPNRAPTSWFRPR